MLKPLRQARKRIGLLTVVFLLTTLPVQAKTPQTAGPVGAGGSQVVHVDDLFSRMTDALDDLWPASKDAKPAEAKSDKPEGEGKTILPKRLDGDSAAKADAKPPAPYKVYPSPVIMDLNEEIDAPKIDPYESARSQMQPSTVRPSAVGSGAAGWSQRQSVPAADPAQPPTLPDHVKQDLGLAPADAGASAAAARPVLLKESDLLRPGAAEQERAAPAVAPQQAQPQARGVAPPLSALPKQFFPILPLGALPDTPPQLLPLASNLPIESDLTETTRAIIVVHDIQRNSAEGVATLMTLAGGDSQSTLILAPQFPMEIDIRRFAPFLPDEGRAVARWPAETGWSVGGESVLPTSRKGISSFSAIDLLMLFLADKRRFPMMQDVILVGHGMGGDFVQRYAAVGQAPDVLAKEGIRVRFVAANPSSYLYFTALRPSGAGGPGFITPGGESCPEMNAYPYGLANLVPYARRTGASAIRLRYPERRVFYLIGTRIVNDNLLDSACAALIQGPDRTGRGRAYARYLAQTYGDTLGSNHIFAMVPQAGYDPVAVYGSACGIEALFGAGRCK